MSSYGQSHRSMDGSVDDLPSRGFSYGHDYDTAGLELTLARRQPIPPPHYSQSVALDTTRERPRTFSCRNTPCDHGPFQCISARGKEFVERVRQGGNHGDRSSGLSPSFGGGGGSATGYPLENYPRIDYEVVRSVSENWGEQVAGSDGVRFIGSATDPITQSVNGYSGMAFQREYRGGDGLYYRQDNTVNSTSGSRHPSIGGVNQYPQHSFPPSEHLYPGHPGMDRMPMPRGSQGGGVSVASGRFGSSRALESERYDRQWRNGRQHDGGDPWFQEDESVASSQTRSLGRQRCGEASSVAPSDTTLVRDRAANSAWASEQRRRQSEHGNYR